MKQPDQLTPSLDVFLPVLNIGQDKAPGLGRELIKGAGESGVGPKTVRKMLKPLESPRAWLASHREVTGLQLHAGIEDASEEHIDELEGYLHEVLSASLGKLVIDTPTLPTKVDPLGEGLALSVAGSPEAIQARILVKGALAHFYRLETVPPEIWSDDESATRPVVAYSCGPASNELLRYLNVALNCDDTLLDERTDIGGLATLPNPLRDQQ
jgi:hypothetical protein